MFKTACTLLVAVTALHLGVLAPASALGSPTLTPTSTSTRTRTASDTPTVTPISTPLPCGTVTEFSIAASGDDGVVYHNSATYPPTMVFVDTGTVFAQTDRSKVGDRYDVRNLLLRWDTRALPDGISICRVTLIVEVESHAEDDPAIHTLTADWYTNWPIDASDYSLSPQTSALAQFDWKPIPFRGVLTLPLDNADGVHTDGYTGLRLHTAPSQQPVDPSDNDLSIWTFDNVTGHAVPILHVEYVTGATTRTLTPTNTPTRTPTPGPTGNGCVGDCNNDVKVAADELLTGVSIALGTAPFETCAAFACATCPLLRPVVTVECLLRGVNNAVNECREPCASDQDCDDGASCTIDRCTPQGCVHDCACD